MIEKITIKEKTTSNIDMQLLADSAGINLTSIDHISMYMIDSTNKTYRYNSNDVSPAVSIITASTGNVRFVPPDPTIFVYQNSPYQLQWKIWETATKAYSVPEEGSAWIYVEKEF